MGRYAIAAYLNVPVYAAFHEWLGGATGSPRCGGCGRGDRKGALAAISVVDSDRLGPARGYRGAPAALRRGGVTTRSSR